MLRSVIQDTSAGFVVFLVALPLCLGLASASAPAGGPAISPLAGVIAGVIGGILVGFLSGSHTSVSGPAVGLTVIVASQIEMLGRFELFLAAVVLAGLLQIAMGTIRVGLLSLFFPSSVVKGLLAAMGILLILKEIPHLVGHDPDPEGDYSFWQPDKQNTFTELIDTLWDMHAGAIAVGVLSLIILWTWSRVRSLRKSSIPAPVIVVGLGILATTLLRLTGDPLWYLDGDRGVHRVQVPVFESFAAFSASRSLPDFAIGDHLRPVLIAALTIAVFASLETLLNLEAADKLDPRKRISDSNRELLAQGVGNIASGLLGGLPVTSVVVRSSVNINAGARTRTAAIAHGVFLAAGVVLFPRVINEIPRSALAAILIVTGIKLASWKIITSVYQQGWPMFLPFLSTVVGIVFTDLLIGTIIGLFVSSAFILLSNLRKPIRRVVEKHIDGEVLHVQLSNQVSFLNRASLATVLEEVPRGGHVLIDASETDYMDPDILDLIRTFEREDAPARGIKVSLRGFHENYLMEDRILYADYTSREVRDGMTPDRVLEILKDGHERFSRDEMLTRDLHRQRQETAKGQAPLAAIVSCIDSRTPVEMIFDCGLGDIFTVRIAGNVADDKVLGSLEFATAVAGAKLILVLGHTKCGAVNAAIDLTAKGATAMAATGCDHLDSVVTAIRPAIRDSDLAGYSGWDAEHLDRYADATVAANVRHTMARLRDSKKIAELESTGTIKIVGGVYDVRTGRIEFEV